MFNKANFGVPQFYPRDLKRRVDEYVVGQDRAKKTICSTIFNHYQRLRRRYHHDDSDRKHREKLQRQRLARDREILERYRDPNPVEGPPSDDSVFQRYSTNDYNEDEFPGHSESTHHLHGTGDKPSSFDDIYTPEDSSHPSHVKIDKSNMLLIGPTGVGKTYILE
jgi:ATP-dependent Clp protease ATP-binding subunit ClpX